jgi:succinyl-CoA synthetase alpha subunit
MIKELRNSNPSILVVGNHIKIIQSILDFDYSSGKHKPSVTAIISTGRNSQKFSWGNEEILIPVFQDISKAKVFSVHADFLLNAASASSAPSVLDSFFESYPDALGCHIFAENIPERCALSMIDKYGDKKFIAGPSGVGLCIPTVLKLGAIGGISSTQVSKLGKKRGQVAVVCSSGGVVNELMYQIMRCGSGISFAVSYGGDRFPVTSALDWMLEAEADSVTSEIVFFGELGGQDEYLIRDAIKAKKIKKPVYAYIAGHYESGENKIQFGHAKALANEESETAKAKMDALDKVGVKVGRTFHDFSDYFNDFSKEVVENSSARSIDETSLGSSKTYFSSPEVNFESSSFTEAILKRLLLRKNVSKELVEFTDCIFKELIDHGPNVSGAVNTMIAARAGRDMTSSLSSGILTIGDRFGGAINNSAKVWFQSCLDNFEPKDLVKEYSKQRLPIPGIGHLKYTLYKPDPRVTTLVDICISHVKERKHLEFALEVASITLEKKQNLILNIDGVISAIMLDYLSEKETMTKVELKKLIDIEFFNSLFIIARSVGFIGNYLDQKRIDEGLFRLDDKDIHFFTGS